MSASFTATTAQNCSPLLTILPLAVTYGLYSQASRPMVLTTGIKVSAASGTAKAIYPAEKIRAAIKTVLSMEKIFLLFAIFLFSFPLELAFTRYYMRLFGKFRRRQRWKFLKYVKYSFGFPSCPRQNLLKNPRINLVNTGF